MVSIIQNQHTIAGRGAELVRKERTFSTEKKGEESH